MGKHLVLVGGGHAHMTILIKLDRIIGRGHRVTLISPSPYHYYSGMGPGMLSGMYRPEEIRFHIRRMAEGRGASFLQGSVVRVDPKGRVLSLDSGMEVAYDVVSFNIGSVVATGSVRISGEGLHPVKPIEGLLEARRAIQDLLREKDPTLMVLGGGPAGLEIAGNLWRLVRGQGGHASIVLVAGRRLLSRFPEKIRRLAMESLVHREIEVVEGAYVRRVQGGRAVLEDGREYSFDLGLLALGVRPSELFKASGFAVGSDDGLLVNECLQSVDYPEIFGGGDCISFKARALAKVGVHAVRQNPILLHNLRVTLGDGGLRPFHPKRRYLLIFNLGDGKGIFWRGRWAWRGKTAFLLKDLIDRRFMRRFQVSGELGLS